MAAVYLLVTLRVAFTHARQARLVRVKIAALFVHHMADAWPHRRVLWLRRLGGKLRLSSDRDRLYVLLARTRAVFVTAPTLAFANQHPFLR